MMKQKRSVCIVLIIVGSLTCSVYAHPTIKRAPSTTVDDVPEWSIGDSWFFSFETLHFAFNDTDEDISFTGTIDKMNIEVTDIGDCLET